MAEHAPEDPFRFDLARGFAATPGSGLSSPRAAAVALTLRTKPNLMVGVGAMFTFKCFNLDILLRER